MEVAVEPTPLPQELFEAFAHPGVGGAAETLEAVWPTFAEEALRLFLEGHRARFDEAAPELARWLRSLDRLSLEETWHPTIGLMALPVALVEEPVLLGSDFALHLLETQAASWSAKPEEAGPVRLRNLVGVVRHLQAAAEGGSVTVSVSAADGAGENSLRLPPNRFEPLPDVGPLTGLGVLVDEPFSLLLTSGALTGDPFYVEEADPFSQAELEDFAEDVRAALQFIAQHAPEYATWVGTGISVLVPCRAPEDMLRSGSSSTLPGLVRVTAGRSPFSTAEMLIHEVTHQYLHVALRLAPVDDGSDPEHYWSPPRNAFRPLNKILTAYHAFANVERFYASALASGFQPDEAAASTIERIGEELDVLERPLRESGALTVAGRGLVDPLIEERAG